MKFWRMPDDWPLVVLLAIIGATFSTAIVSPPELPKSVNAEQARRISPQKVYDFYVGSLIYREQVTRAMYACQSGYYEGQCQVEYDTAQWFQIMLWYSLFNLSHEEYRALVLTVPRIEGNMLPRLFPKPPPRT